MLAAMVIAASVSQPARVTRSGAAVRGAAANRSFREIRNVERLE
jgi:hypothetical protein